MILFLKQMLYWDEPQVAIHINVLNGITFYRMIHLTVKKSNQKLSISGFHFFKYALCQV